MMSDFPILDGALEIRVRGDARVLSGRFPYDKIATIKSVGRVRKERFKSGSMGWQIREFEKLQAEMAQVIESTIEKARKDILIEQLEDALEKRNTHLLVGHDYNRAIADMRTGNLAVKHTRNAVEIEATLPDEANMPSWIRDAVLAVRGGQLRGVSPGFQVPRKGAEKLIPEPGNPGVMIREIEDAVVFEYSLVARPAYASTSVSARGDDPAATAGRRRVWL